MIDSFLPKQFFLLLRKLSPSMLLLSLAMHGIVLLIPLSLYRETKSQPHATKTADHEAALPLIASTPHSTEFFSQEKTLVKPQTFIKPLIANNPQFIAQLPSLPPGAVAQTTETLPIPTVKIPQASPISNPIPEVTPAPVSVAIPKKKPAKPNRVSSIKKLTPTSDSSKREKVAVTNSAPKQDVKTKPISPAPIATQPTQAPESLPANAEEQALDSIFVKLDEEIGFSEELNFSEPEKFTLPINQRGSIGEITPQVKKVLGKVTGKTPEELAITLQNQLEIQGFKISQINSYTGGLLYVITKGKFTEYVTLTPNQEATGTIIVTWSNPKG
jgi:hypothetical protein